MRLCRSAAELDGRPREARGRSIHLARRPPVRIRDFPELGDASERETYQVVSRPGRAIRIDAGMTLVGLREGRWER
jgi:hypothetical protein